MENVVEDAKKLRAGAVQGIVAFVLFPLDLNKDQWSTWLRFIDQELFTNIAAQSNQYFQLVTVPLGPRGGNNNCNVGVCCFLYP